MEYQINENTTYIDEGYESESLRYNRKDGSSLVVNFFSDTAYDGDYESPGYSYNAVKVYIQTPKSTQEQKEETPNLQKAKQSVFKKLFAKKQKEVIPEKSTANKELFSTEVLFQRNYSSEREYRIGKTYYVTLNEFMQKPIELEPEFQEVGKIIEKARQIILTDGHKLREEAARKAEKVQKAEHAIFEQKCAEERALRDKQIADKIKGFDL